jgi:hypothetical protein
MMVLLISSTLTIGAITGFVFFTEGEFFCGVAGQVAHGLLSIVCFALVGIAFWRFGWKVGVVGSRPSSHRVEYSACVFQIPKKEVVGFVALSKLTASGADRRFKFQKRSQLFIGTHNETLSLVPMRINKPDCSPARINCRIDGITLAALSAASAPVMQLYCQTTPQNLTEVLCSPDRELSLGKFRSAAPLGSRITKG